MKQLVENLSDASKLELRDFGLQFEVSHECFFRFGRPLFRNLVFLELPKSRVSITSKPTGNTVGTTEALPAWYLWPWIILHTESRYCMRRKFTLKLNTIIYVCTLRKNLGNANLMKYVFLFKLIVSNPRSIWIKLGVWKSNRIFRLICYVD